MVRHAFSNFIARAAFAAFALTLCPSATGHAQGSPTAPHELEDRLQRALAVFVAEQQLPGANVAVSIDGHIHTVSVGFADRERGVRMNADHRMLIGSAGKTFFAFVALSLAREGKLGLDEPLSKWLGGEPWFGRLPNAGVLTMRLLLSHRSGIPNHVADSGFVRAMRNRDRQLHGFTAAEQIAYVLDKPAPFRAGGDFLYTDTGYLIAALALERAAGHTYYEEVTRRVLRPLRLDATSPSDHPDLANLAQGYVMSTDPAAAGNGWLAWGLPSLIVSNGRLMLNPVYEWTGGGLVSTSSDLARWMETLFERAPWKSVGDSMVANLPANATYGLGIFVRTTPDGIIYGHPGGFPGYLTQIAYSPELGVGVAFQTNAMRADLNAALRVILEAVRASRNH